MAYSILKSCSSPKNKVLFSGFVCKWNREKTFLLIICYVSGYLFTKKKTKNIYNLIEKLTITVAIILYFFSWSFSPRNNMPNRCSLFKEEFFFSEWKYKHGLWFEETLILMNDMETKRKEKWDKNKSQFDCWLWQWHCFNKITQLLAWEFTFFSLYFYFFYHCL